MKKMKWVIGGVSIVTLLLMLFITGVLASITGGQTSKSSDCLNQESNTTEQDNSEVPASIEEFVAKHADAYILSWKAGGFLPSASIAQTMVENGFNFTNPSGTSFWQAHNMGGVKTSKLSDFPLTIATFGKDSVDITGTKPGTNVGDNTGGAYTWFKDYSAGIVGKAEFMAHQTLYTGAINNTDGVQALTAIYQGGWATEASYLIKLHTVYQNLGTKFQWLDQEAIRRYGNAPYKNIEMPSIELPPGNSDEDDLCISDSGNQIVGENSAPTLSPPDEYVGKLPLPAPDSNNYAGNAYPFGQCTWGAYNRMAQIGQSVEWFSGDGGKGGAWGATAQSQGYTVEKGNASVGWAACFPGGLAGSDPVYGHIAVVEYVNDDGSILISETNVVNMGSGTRSWRVLNKETVQQMEFIKGRGK